VFDAVEQARVEALGARAMDGVRANLSQAVEMRMRTDPITRARSRAEVPLGTALGLKVRERLTGEAPPEAARGGIALVSDWIEEKAGADLDALGLVLDDQAAFAALATKLLRDLELIEGEAEAEPDPDDGDEGEDGDRDEGDEGEEGDEEDQGGGTGEAEMRVEPGEADDEEGERDWSEEEMAEGEEGQSDEGEEGALPARPNRPHSDLPPQFDYRIFTTRYDEVVEATELCDEEELGAVFAPISTSSSSICRAPSPSSPTGSSGG
jgi:cobaltochelatase CobT